MLTALPACVKGGRVACRSDIFTAHRRAFKYPLMLLPLRIGICSVFGADVILIR